jgi:tRNA A37 threonylcarbamoyladenosine synthetase subunit TsaC/SUA5/YrdC
MEIKAQTLKPQFQPVSLTIVFSDEAELEAFKALCQRHENLSLEAAMPNQEMADQASVLLQEIGNALLAPAAAPDMDKQPSLSTKALPTPRRTVPAISRT